jgi:uncharacterized membrane protein YfcA
MDWLIVPGATAKPAAYFAAAVAAVMLVGVSKGGFGTGLGMLSVPVMMQVAPATSVLPMMLPVLIACDILAIREYPRFYSRQAIVRVAPGALAGLLLGWGVLWWLSRSGNESLRTRNDALLRLGIGGLCVAFVALYACSRMLSRRREFSGVGGTRSDETRQRFVAEENPPARAGTGEPQIQPRPPSAAGLESCPRRPETSWVWAGRQTGIGDHPA